MINKIQVSEFAVLAERIAHERAEATETLRRMAAEAAQLQIELADALFGAYVGKRLVSEYRDNPTQQFTLLRFKHHTGKCLHLFAFNVEQKEHSYPGARPRYDYPQGWVVTVAWNQDAQRMQASLQRVCESAHGQKTFSGGTGDIGTQAVVLAQALAQEIGERLVIERNVEAKS